MKKITVFYLYRSISRYVDLAASHCTIEYEGVLDEKNIIIIKKKAEKEVTVARIGKLMITGMTPLE